MNCCMPGNEGTTCCKVESLVSIDERGQMVLPKELRERCGIHSGDKLALISWGRDEKIFCVSLIKAEELTEIIKDILGPMMKELSKEGK